MQVGDLVRVTDDPSDMWVKIKGVFGFIEQMNATHAAIMALTEDGVLSGGGSVRLDCLRLETDPRRINAYEVYKARWAEHLRKTEEYSRRCARVTEAAANRLAAELGITPEQVRHAAQRWDGVWEEEMRK